MARTEIGLGGARGRRVPRWHQVSQVFLLSARWPGLPAAQWPGSLLLDYRRLMRPRDISSGVATASLVSRRKHGHKHFVGLEICHAALGLEQEEGEFVSLA